MDKISDAEQRIWYIQKTIENGWSRNVMVMQIASKLHERQGKALTNFKTTLPPITSDWRSLRLGAEIRVLHFY